MILLRACRCGADPIVFGHTECPLKPEPHDTGSVLCEPNSRCGVKHGNTTGTVLWPRAVRGLVPA